MTEAYLAPLWISVRTVLVATAITFFAGIAAARWIARYSGKFKNLIDAIFILPLVLPPTVVGLGLLILFGKHGPLGEFLAVIQHHGSFFLAGDGDRGRGNVLPPDVHDLTRGF